MIVHEAVTEAIVHAMHAESPPRQFKLTAAREVKMASETKRPKEGGRCDAVWRELDRISVKRDTTPALKDILKVGERRQWNANNTRVEYYNWRRAQGISGRLDASA